MGCEKLKDKKLLWIAPEFNHYRVDMVNSLVGEFKYIKVICGIPLEAEGHKMENEDRITFDTERLNCNYRNFGYRFTSFHSITNSIKQGRYDYIMFSIEKKFIFLIIWLIFLKARYRFILFSYNHYIDKQNGWSFRINYYFLNIVSFFYDKIIFYTKAGFEKAIHENKINRNKIGFANNTLVVKDSLNMTKDVDANGIIFVGRMIKSKRIDIIFEYYKELKKDINNLKVFVIGSGPELENLKSKYNDKDIIFTGSIINEHELRTYYSKSKIHFCPGRSGLSIVQSFAYSTPFFTLSQKNIYGHFTHGPEFSYIKDRYNGVILNGNFEENCQNFKKLFNDKEYYETLLFNCIDTYNKLKITNWSEQLINSISN